MRPRAADIPVVRHPFLEFPNDHNTYDLRYQFMFGSEFMVAPVVDAGAQRVRLYLPAAQWTNLWTGESIASKGQWVDQPRQTGQGAWIGSALPTLWPWCPRGGPALRTLMISCRPPLEGHIGGHPRRRTPRTSLAALEWQRASDLRQVLTPRTGVMYRGPSVARATTSPREAGRQP
jgi:Glycosyl hydrolases family 31